ncbi:MAG: peptidylprolyl isomerase [Thermoguttaceae bacterium]
MNEGKQVVTLIAFSFIVLTGFLIWRLAGQAAPPPSSKSARGPAVAGKRARPARPPPSSKTATEPAAAGKVVATVNGEPIFESELMACLPGDAFQAQLDSLKESKLKRLVEEAVEWQFLKDRKVALSDEEFKRAAADFETMVKTPGCPCCGGGFASVEQFMQVNSFSPQELHRRITCDSGLKLYAARLAKEQTSPQALAERLKKHRAQIEKDCMMAYTISFDYTRDPGFRDEKTVQAEIEKIASDALARLKKGDSFEKVAKDMAEDGTADPNSGALECVRTDYLDPEVQKVLGTLEPGKFSPVIKTAWSYCIVKRKKLTDDELLSAVKEQAKTAAEDQMYQELDVWRKQAKIQYSAGYAPASAPVEFGAK